MSGLHAVTRPIRSVALVVQDGVESFGLGALCEVFAEPYHPEEDNPVFDFRVVTPRPGRVRGSSGYDLVVDHDLSFAADADLVCVVPYRDYTRPDPAVVDLVREVDARQAWLFAHCTAVYALGLAGVLDGRRYATHWRHADALAAAFPLAQLDRDVLYVHDDHVLTGAGTAAGIDAALHLLRQTYGAKVSADAARRMVVPPQRDGGQAQFIARPVPTCDSETLAALLDWIGENLTADLTVDRLAAELNQSPRTFARRFKQETGATPYSWVLSRRVQAAEELLERSDASIDEIADQVGFGTAAVLRHHFTRARGVSPTRYRRAFSVSAPAPSRVG
ncbi:MAG: GlxA family transcriptional regulator [Nocardioides sp.]|uniref:GlxA family transcriptional regulator n=1 Tax=Nocardioides sp. TaxID=35761 RepID=UPI003F0F9D83